MLAAIAAAVGAAPPVFDAITVNWGNITASGGATEATSTDETITFSVGASRSIGASKTGTGTLYYRINSGSWVAYSTPFTVTTGQTVGWKIEYLADTSGTVTVTDNTRGGTIDTFNHTATGVP